MSKYLEEAKRLRAIKTPHYNCAQSVVVSFLEETGVSEETAMKMAVNFGGGMKRASVCGAITGGLMTLGLCGMDNPKVLAEYHAKLKARHNGCLECADLLKMNKEKGGEKKPHCDAMVYECVELVEEILKREGKLSS